MKQKVLLISFLVLQTIAYSKILNDSIPSGKNFEIASFRLWYPDNIKHIKGILVLMPGSNRDGRNEVADSTWQHFAKQHSFAIIGCYYKDYNISDNFIERYVKVSDGSGQALIDVISRFAIASGYSEFQYAPLIMWGHSAGGQFNYEFMCWKPERVIAFIVNKGGIYYTAMAPEEARKVPGVLFTGENDLDARNDIIKGLFSMNRRAGALWIYAPEPEVGHEIGLSKTFSIVFFNEIIPLRLSDNGNLNNLSVAKGLLGDHKNKCIAPFSDLGKINYPVSWFPTKLIADVWANFITSKPF